MKKKLGPLPLWSWILIAGGTVAVIWYLRSSGSSTTSTDAGLDSTLPLTSAAPTDTSGGGGGVTSADSTPVSAITNDDLYNALMGIDSDVQTLAGGQGAAVEQNPTQTFSGEVADVTAGIQGLQGIGALFAGAAGAPSLAPTVAAKAASGAVEKVETIVKPSAANNGALWVYHYYPNRSGPTQYIAIRPASPAANTTQQKAAPAKAAPKATPKKTTTSSKKK